MRSSIKACWARAVWHVAWTLMCLALILSTGTCTEEHQSYDVSSLCKTHFLQQLHRTTYGAQISSRNERNLNCVLTFQTDSILQRFLLRFSRLQLDCNDHLYIYDGAHDIGNYKADLSCRNTQETVGTIFTRTNFVTLKYVTDAWGTDNNGFKLIITSFRDDKHSCEGFTCSTSELCISKALVCDGFEHCPDGSDEMTADCADSNLGHLLGLSLTASIGIAAAALLVCCLLIVLVTVVCVRRRGRQPARAATNSYQMQNQDGYNSNGTFSEKVRGTTVLPGNLAPPVEWLGLNVRLICWL